jgi:glutamate dehydrogenase
MYMQQMGAKIIAVSDVSCTLLNENGLDIESLIEFTQKSKNKIITGFPKAQEELDPEAILALDVDILSPCALENVLRVENAKKVKAKIICEGANGPTTPEADKILSDKGVLLIPDILANSGGVIVSYFEWVQDNQDYYWTADEVRQNLDRMLMKALTEVKELVAATGRSWREAALMIGVGRVAEAHRLRGLYP